METANWAAYPNRPDPDQVVVIDKSTLNLVLIGLRPINGTKCSLKIPKLDKKTFVRFKRYDF